MQLVLEKIKRQIELVDKDEDTRKLAVKKIKECVSQNLESISEQSKLLATEKINDNKYSEEDLSPTESNSTVGKNKNGKQIFDKGKAEGLFKSYSSSHSLKTSYYHLQKRRKL